MNTFERKLAQNAKEHIAEGAEIVKDVKLLLAADAQKEISTLKSIGLDVDLRIAEGRKEDIMIRSTHGKALERQVVHISEIEKLCLQYRLFMRPAREYAGRIPADLGAELARFCEEKNIVLPNSSEYSKFFIIAPPKMFVKYKTPLQVLTHSIKEVWLEEKERREEAARERQRLRDMDPLLVYELPNQPDYYAIIKSWGNDFTPLRRLYAFMTKKFVLKMAITALHALVVYGLFRLAVVQTNYFWYTLDKNPYQDGDNGWGVVAVLLDGVITVLAFISIFSPMLTVWGKVIDTVTLGHFNKAKKN